MAITGTSDLTIPGATLTTISLAKLHAQDAAELALLNKVASGSGFFYLDLRGDSSGEKTLAQLQDIWAVTEKYFTQPEAAKKQDVRLDIKPSQDLGWKKIPGGESFELSRDEVASAGASISQLPPLFKGKWAEISAFIAGCDEACLTLLSSLSADFEAHHRVDHPSDTGLKLVLHPSLEKLSDAGDNLHTDGGTITLMFYTDWSIYGFLRDLDIWSFTAPPPDGCALINVANSLERLSEGRLHSPRHGVTQPSDGAKDRFYLSYYLRPETKLLEAWNAAK